MFLLFTLHALKVNTRILSFVDICMYLSTDRLGGPDPLDYVSMYANDGDPNNGIPPHWHYISFGLSDLHGDGRVHQ